MISSAATKFGVPPKLLHLVGLQESGLGKGLTADGRSPDSKNAGHGIWQLDPASGASPEVLAKVARDPGFAAQVAAAMLARNLQATHGDVRGALAMYNAGSPTSAKGLQYADEVLSRASGPG